MTNNYGVEEAIANEAFDAAKKAEQDFMAQHGDPNYCGFAWVRVRPGNCRMAKYLTTKNLASKGYKGGVEVWSPGKSNTQSMEVKEAGARAFADVLKKYGYDAYAMSRPD